jgi:hypothetical protein
MTLPIERTYAISNAREFLRSLLDPKQTPRVPKKIRSIARSVLKHYPSNFDMDMMFEGKKVFEQVSKRVKC